MPPVPPVAGVVVAVDPPTLVVPPVLGALVLPPNPDATAPVPAEVQAAIEKLAARRANSIAFAPEAFCPTCPIAFIAFSVDSNNCGHLILILGKLFPQARVAFGRGFQKK
jgi:hypothetical protein